MDFEKYTDRAKGFVQSAQSLALREGHQQFGPDHLLKVLLDDPEGMAAGLIQRAGGQPGDALKAVELALAKRPKVSGGGAGQIYLAPELARVFDTAQKIADKAGDKFVTVERMLLALAMEQSDAARVLKDAGVNPTSLNAGHQRHPQGPHGRQRLCRAGLRRPEALCARPHRAGRRGQDRSRDRPRRGDPPHHPGAVPAHQEQPRADRRARRRQDRHRRRAGAAHRQRRRAREPEGQEAAGARHGLADRRRQVPRRVRGAAEGRAVGGAGRGRPHHPVHRRAAHHRRRRQGRGRDGCRQPAQARARARRAALRRRHHARRVQEAHREGCRPGAALPAGVRQRADGGGHHLHPARPQGEVRAAPRRAHHRFARSSPPRRSPTATSPTASCPTRPST